MKPDNDEIKGHNEHPMARLHTYQVHNQQASKLGRNNHGKLAPEPASLGRQAVRPARQPEYYHHTEDDQYSRYDGHCCQQQSRNGRSNSKQTPDRKSGANDN
jgi:hypothetical protein